MRCPARSQGAILPSAAGDPDLHLYLDGPSLLLRSRRTSSRTARRMSSGNPASSSGSAAAFKGAVIGVEGRQTEGVLLDVGLDIDEAGLTEEQLQASGVAKRKGTSDALGQAWHTLIWKL